jgi:hypothetical protein
MLKKTNLLFVLFSIAIILLLIAAVIKVRILRSDVINHSSVKEVVSPIVSNNYVYSFQTGFEGYNKDITYQINVVDSKNLIFATSTNISEIIIRDSNSSTTHKIRTFNNDGAGFASVAELWNNTELKTLCPDCRVATTTAKLGSQLVGGATYIGKNKLFYIFPLLGKELFLIVETDRQNPINKLINDIKIDIKTSTTTPSATEMKNIKLFFVNTEIRPVVNCDELVPVIRQIPASTKSVATEAMKLLVAGPTAEEKNQGYTTSFPEGSAIKSISINQKGDVQVDFNSVVNTGGGSCHFRILRSQIEETLFQFPTVKRIKIMVDGKSGAQIFNP